MASEKPIHKSGCPCSACNWEGSTEANAALLNQAVELFHTTGKTPRELAGDVAILTERVKVLERERDEFRDMLKKLSNIYVHVFDMQDGGGYMAPESVSRFEQVNEEVFNLLARVNQPAAVTGGAE